MKATLTFNLPEEATEHRQALDGGEWEAVVWGVDQTCRSWLKYGHTFKTPDEALEAIRDYLREEMEGLNFSP